MKRTIHVTAAHIAAHDPVDPRGCLLARAINASGAPFEASTAPDSILLQWRWPASRRARHFLASAIVVPMPRGLYAKVVAVERGEVVEPFSFVLDTSHKSGRQNIVAWHEMCPREREVAHAA